MLPLREYVQARHSYYPLYARIWPPKSYAFPLVTVHLLISDNYRLNSFEVSRKSAVAAACVAPDEFSDVLKKVRAALAEKEQDRPNVTYEGLVKMYRMRPMEKLIGYMKGIQAAFRCINMLTESDGIHGTRVMTFAVFYWVCWLLEEPSMQEQTEQSVCKAWSLPLESFKAALAALDKEGKSITNELKARLFGASDTGQALASSQASHVPLPNPNPNPASTQKSSAKSPIRPGSGTSTPMTTPAKTMPAKKRTRNFWPSSDFSDSDDNNNNAPKASGSKSAASSQVVSEAADTIELSDPDPDSPPRKRSKKDKERACEPDSSDDDDSLAFDRIEQRLLTMQAVSKQLETEQANVLAEIVLMKARRRRRIGKY